MRRSVSSTKKKKVVSIFFSFSFLRWCFLALISVGSSSYHRCHSSYIGFHQTVPLTKNRCSLTVFQLHTLESQLQISQKIQWHFFFFMVLSSNFLIVPFRCHDCEQCPLVVTDMVHIFGIFLVADLHIKKHDQKILNSFFANFVVVVYC